MARELSPVELQRRREAIIRGFERSFGYQPSNSQVQEISDFIDGLPAHMRPNLQELSAGSITNRFGGSGGDSWIATNFSEYAWNPRQSEAEEIARLRQRSDIAPALEQQEVQATADQLEARLGITLMRDENGDVMVDPNGLLLTTQVDPRTGLRIAVDPATGEQVVSLFTDPEAEEPDPFIGGFPEDYRVRDLRFEGEEELISRLDPQARASVQASIDREGEPRYRQWDQWRHFASKSSEYQTQVQQEMVAAGLLNEGDMVKGVWTFEAARVMERLMAESNATGGSQSWVDLLGQYKRGAVEDGGDERERGALAGRRLTLPAFVEPDYASLSQSVKSLFRNQLGRDPLDWEVALLADQLNTDYRSQYDAEANALRSEFEAGNRAILLSEDSDDPTITSAGTVQGVDPVARLRERFETKYGPELELNEDRIEERQQLGNVFSILTQTSNLMGGGIR